MSATTKQLGALHAILHKKGLLQHKAEMVEGVSGGRTRSSKDLTSDEIRELLMNLNEHKEKSAEKDKGPQIKKLYAMAHEIGFISKVTTVDAAGNVQPKTDASKLKEWVLKFGYLTKDLSKYSYNELPKLISQFEFRIYLPYLKGLSKR